MAPMNDFYLKVIFFMESLSVNRDVTLHKFFNPLTRHLDQNVLFKA